MSANSSEEFLQYVSSYDVTNRVVEHPTLGDFTILQNEKGHRILRKLIDARELSKVDIGIFEQYKSLAYSRIVQFLGVTENLEGEGYAAYYEYFNENLKEEIERKGQEGTAYAELEVLKILQNISASLSFMMQSKVFHGEIKSLNIVKVGQDYKVLNPILFAKVLHLQKDARPSLPKFHTKIITPEVRNALYRDIIDPVHEKYKDDVYGLGLIALDLMTLKVDPTMPVEKRLEGSNFLFSNVLVRFVKKMVERIVSLRLDPVSCNSYIERIQLQHGLVSAQRFSTRGRNQSVMGRSSVIGEESFTSNAPEESIPTLQKQPSKENRYNRRTESVAAWRPSVTETPSSNVDLRMHETVTRTVTVTSVTTRSNEEEEQQAYAKKIGDFDGGRDSIRQSTASTAFGSEPRMTRWDTWRESNRWSVWDTPRTSNVGGPNTDRTDTSEPIRNTADLARAAESRIGFEEYKLGETKPQQGNSPVTNSYLDTPVGNHLFSTPSKSNEAAVSLQSTPEDIMKNCKYVQSEVATPQAAMDNAWKYDVNSDRSYSRAGTGVTTLKESVYGNDIQVPSYNTQAAYYTPEKEKVEITAKSIYVPAENRGSLSVPTQDTELMKRVSPRFVEFDKDRFTPVTTSDISIDNQLKPTTQYTLNLDGAASHQRLHTNSFLVSMNDILPTEMRQTYEGQEEEEVTMDYIEAEQSMDQTFSAECQEPALAKQFEVDSRYSFPAGQSSTALMTELNLSKEEVKPERRTMAPQTYSSSNYQQDFTYVSSYQPRQSYEMPSYQSKMAKTTVETLADGSVYEGEVLGYMKQGKGKLTYPDGKYYEGEWKVGQISGQGKLCTAGGSIIYDGQWQDAKYHGRGTLYNLVPIARGFEGTRVPSKEEGAWTRYSGSFRNNQWEGSGELYFANGDQYVGEFKRDALNGKGTYMKADRQVWEGQWLNNLFIENCAQLEYELGKYTCSNLKD